jgi:hypothetical protein
MGSGKKVSLPSPDWQAYSGEEGQYQDKAYTEDLLNWVTGQSSSVPQATGARIGGSAGGVSGIGGPAPSYDASKQQGTQDYYAAQYADANRAYETGNRGDITHTSDQDRSRQDAALYDRQVALQGMQASGAAPTPTSRNTSVYSGIQNGINTVINAAKAPLASNSAPGVMIPESAMSPSKTNSALSSYRSPMQGKIEIPSQVLAASSMVPKQQSTVGSARSPISTTATQVGRTVVGPASTYSADQIAPTSMVEKTTLGPTSSYEGQTLGKTNTYKAANIAPTANVKGATIKQTQGYDAADIGPASQVEGATIDPVTGYRAARIAPTSTFRGADPGDASTYNAASVGQAQNYQGQRLGQGPNIAQQHKHDSAVRDNQTRLINNLEGAVAGAGPSAAAGTIQQAVEASMRANSSMLGANRGQSNVGALGNRAANQSALLQAAGLGKAAELKVQEQQQARQELAGVTQAVRGQDIDLSTRQGQLEQDRQFKSADITQQRDLEGARLAQEAERDNAAANNQFLLEQSKLSQEASRDAAAAKNQRALERATFAQEAAREAAGATNTAALEQARLRQEASKDQFTTAADRAVEQARLAQEAQTTNAGSNNAVALEQARLAQEANKDLFMTDAQRALEQARLQQEAQTTNAGAKNTRALSQAQLAQEAAKDAALQKNQMMLEQARLRQEADRDNALAENQRMLAQGQITAAEAAQNAAAINQRAQRQAELNTQASADNAAARNVLIGQQATLDAQKAQADASASNSLNQMFIDRDTKEAIAQLDADTKINLANLEATLRKQGMDQTMIKDMLQMKIAQERDLKLMEMQQEQDRLLQERAEGGYRAGEQTGLDKFGQTVGVIGDTVDTATKVGKAVGGMAAL